jgi:hypothetical protein
MKTILNGSVRFCVVLRLLVTAKIVPSSPILVTIIMEGIRASETSFRTRATRRNIPASGMLQISPCVGLFFDSNDGRKKILRNISEIPESNTSHFLFK